MDETPHEHSRRVSSSNGEEKKSSKRSESTNGHRKERAPQQWDGKGVPPLWAIAEASPDVLSGYVAAVRKRRRYDDDDDDDEKEEGEVKRRKSYYSY